MQKIPQAIVVTEDKELGLNIISAMAGKGIEAVLITSSLIAVEKAFEIIPSVLLFDDRLAVVRAADAARIIRKNEACKHTRVYVIDAENEPGTMENEGVISDDRLARPKTVHDVEEMVTALLNIPAGTRVSGGHKGHLVADRESYLVHYNGSAFSFPKKEFELIALFVANPGKVLTRKLIFHEVWNKSLRLGNTRTIDVHVCKLREKLTGITIVTIKGVGYKYSGRK